MKKMHALEKQGVDIRPLEKTDIDELVKHFTFHWTDADTTRAKWHSYYKQHSAGERFVCLITKNKRIVGYGSLLPESEYQPFQEDGVFEIHDIWVEKAERRQGLATLLITYFESIAQDEEVDYIGAGVGLQAQCAAAQQLYVHLGYKPDGEGMTHKGVPVVPGASYPVDDDLRLWFVKDVSN